MNDTPVPEGYARYVVSGEFIAVNGPLYLRRDPPALGLRVERRHTNMAGRCHGGMIATFCDMVLPVCSHLLAPAIADRFLPTVSLQIDYAAPVALGAWLEGTAQVLRVTRSLVFAQALVTADGQLAARASGILKIGPPFDQAAAAGSDA